MLKQLREFTDIVVDTGDLADIIKYAESDVTTNPSLLLKAAQSDSSYIARAKAAANTDDANLIAEHFAVQVGAEIAKHISGLISTEVDASLSFDTAATIEQAHRLIAMYEAANVDKSQVLIKVAGTYEGIKAAEILEAEGIRCNVTLIFSLEQAVLAAEAGAYLISPFVGRVTDWYKKAEGVEHYEAERDPGVVSVKAIYSYYKSKGHNTIVMGASFRNVEQIIALAGCDKLTVAPNLIAELAGMQGNIKPQMAASGSIDEGLSKLSEAKFRCLLNQNIMATEQLARGINGFIEAKNDLLNLIEQH